MAKALVVTDMLNGFCHPDGSMYCGEGVEALVDSIEKKVRQYHMNGDRVIFVCDRHKKNDKEFNFSTPHCIQGTWESEVVDKIKGAIVKHDWVVPKTRYSAFYGSIAMERALEDINPTECEVVGVCTNLCILYTVEELRNRDYHVYVDRNYVMAFDNEAHLWALKQMKESFGVEIL